MNNEIHSENSNEVNRLQKNTEFPNFVISQNRKKWKKNNKKTLSGFDHKIYQTIKSNKGLIKRIEREKSGDVMKKEREGLGVRKEVEKVKKIKDSL